jgi:hypothetical protein
LLIKTFLQACAKFDEVQRSHAAVSRATSDELCQIIDGSAERNSANNAKSAPRGGYRIFTQLHSTNDGCALHLALQLLFLKASESMGNHDSEVVGACSVD